MGTVLLAVRLALAAVFASAAFGKLRDPAGTRRTVVEFGVAESAARWVAIGLPLAELPIALALLPVSTAWVAGVAALALLGAFTAVIVFSLARGRRPPCHCFGSVSGEPIGRSTVFRNLALLAMAGVLVGFGRSDAGLSITGWAAEASLVEKVSIGVSGLSLLAVIVLGWMLLEVSRGYGRTLLRLDDLERRLSGLAPATPVAVPQQPGLPLGSAVPEFQLPDLAGRVTSLPDVLDPSRPTLLVFSDPGCSPCDLMLPEIAGWRESRADALSIVLFTRGDLEVNRKKFAEWDRRRVLHLPDLALAERLGTAATPSAVLARPDGRIASAPAIGPEAIRALVKRTGAPVAPPSANGGAPVPLPIGAEAPAFVLRTLDGDSYSSAELEGHATVVLFWNPGCGFCQRMAPDVREWEAQRRSGNPRLLVISTGTVEENRDQRFTSRILLDPSGHAIARSFGTMATPSAVLVSSAGRIASGVATGAEPVLAMLGHATSPV